MRPSRPDDIFPPFDEIGLVTAEHGDAAMDAAARIVRNSLEKVADKVFEEEPENRQRQPLSQEQNQTIDRLRDRARRMQARIIACPHCHGGIQLAQ